MFVTNEGRQERLFRKPGLAILGMLITGLMTVSSANADVFNGVFASATEGITTDSNAGVYFATDFTSVGGEGNMSAMLNAFDSTMQGTMYGNMTGDVDSALLRSKSQPTGVTDAALGYASSLATYQYDGPGPATISYEYFLTGELTEPVDAAATLRARAALLTDVAFFTVNYGDFFEGGGTIQDSFTPFYTDAGIVDETGVLSFVANPGDKFYLFTSLQTYGGRVGAISDASNTLKGNLTSSQGTISALAVPEPGSTAVGFVVMMGMLMRRKR